MNFIGMKPPEQTPAPQSNEIRVVKTDPAVNNGWDVLRGDTFLSFHRTEEAANKERERLMRPLAGFGGWLILFVVGLGVQIVRYGAEALRTSDPLVIVFDLYLIVAAVIAGVKLVWVHGKAVKWANIFLISSLILFVLALIGGNYKVGLQGIFYVGLWFTYFKTSVRVRNTWPPKPVSVPTQSQELKVAEVPETVGTSPALQKEGGSVAKQFWLAPQFVMALALLGIAAAVSYYYVIELPKENRERLALEQKKYDDDQTEKAAAKLAEQSSHDSYLQDVNYAQIAKAACEDEAVKQFNARLAANGTPDPEHKGFYTGNREMFKQLTDQEESEKKACDVEFQREIEVAKSRWNQR